MKKFIPLDKSSIIGMGLLDIINGYKDIETFLGQQKILSEDLLALKRASELWRTNEPIDVGESGTLYRLLQFASWKLGLNKKFIIRGTLKNKKITDDPGIVNLPLEELLKLDNGTSQWATATKLLGNKETVSNPPYKLKITYEAIRHWKKRRKEGLSWEPRQDETILKQAETFLSLSRKENAKFIAEQAEDYCFARAFNFISQEEGLKRWPSLQSHESNRILEMENALNVAQKGEEIISKDHRVIQAIVMWGIVNNSAVKIKHPEAVNKSWPEFWEFISEI